MSDLRKAAEMALEALEGSPELLVDWLDKLREVREALRQALAQPEQEPVAWMHKEGDRIKDFYTADEGEDCENCEHCIPLYTAPPKREWIGLEDEDVATVKNEFNRGALWAEQVLKEKNT